MSAWEEFGLEERIQKILDIPPSKGDHHFGRPFLTTYQIAIELAKEITNLCTSIDKPLGGKGTGEYNSLAQYIGLELSKRIKGKKIPNIEGGHLHHKDLTTVEFSFNGESVISSDLVYLSMYRRIDLPSQK